MAKRGYSPEQEARENTAKALADRFCQIYNGKDKPSEESKIEMKKYTKDNNIDKN